MRPEFVVPYECISFIYEFKRIEAVKAIEYAKKAMEVDKKSMIGRYVLAKNEKDVD